MPRLWWVWLVPALALGGYIAVLIVIPAAVGLITETVTRLQVRARKGAHRG